MASVELKGVRTEERDAEKAAEDICNQLSSTPKLLTFFASRDRDHTALNRALRTRLPKTRLVGSSSAAEIDGTGLHTGCIVAAGLSGDFEVGLGLGRRLSIEPVNAGTTAILKACEELGVRPSDLTKRHVGMVIDDGYKYKKEELLIGMLEPNPSLVLVGGGASDAQLDPSKANALVHVDDDVATDAVLIALFQTDARWAAMRSHWYQPTGRTMKITKVDETGTRALEIDGHPAAKRYAEMLGVQIDDLEFGKPNGFATSPTALLVGREYFLRAPWKPLEDGSILFANLLEEGNELELMRVGDMAGSTRRFFQEDMPGRVGNPTAALLFNCSGRHWFSEALGVTQDISNAFTAAPFAVGMNCHFEMYCGFNINTTLNALAFGRS